MESVHIPDTADELIALIDEHAENGTRLTFTVIERRHRRLGRGPISRVLGQASDTHAERPHPGVTFTGEIMIEIRRSGTPNVVIARLESFGVDAIQLVPNALLDRRVESGDAIMFSYDIVIG